MDFGHCPECNAPAVLVVDVLAICSSHCGWSYPVTLLQHSRGGGLWFEHCSPGRGWGRRWCSAEAVPCR